MQILETYSFLHVHPRILCMRPISLRSFDVCVNLFRVLVYIWYKMVRVNKFKCVIFSVPWPFLFLPQTIFSFYWICKDSFTWINIGKTLSESFSWFNKLNVKCWWLRWSNWLDRAGKGVVSMAWYHPTPEEK